MIPAWLGWTLYGLVGVVSGLAAANFILDEPNPYSSDDAFDAVIGFAMVAALWPLFAAGFVVYGVIRAGAWLLPAYRERKRAERRKRDAASETRRRSDVDRLHKQLGLDPVEWGEP